MMRKVTEKPEKNENISLSRSCIRDLKNDELMNHPNIG